jgi:hypothetical protein
LIETFRDLRGSSTVMKTTIIAVAAALALVEMLQMALPQRAVPVVNKVEFVISGRPTTVPDTNTLQVRKLRITPVQAEASVVGLAFSR